MVRVNVSPFEQVYLDKLLSRLQRGVWPDEYQIGVLDDVNQRLKERLVDQPVNPQMEYASNYWMARFQPYLDMTPDEGDKSGCWVWTGASQGGVRPVYRDEQETLPVRAKMLKLFTTFRPPVKSRIATQCHTTNCVRAAHLKVTLKGQVLWPLDEDEVTAIPAEAPLTVERAPQEVIIDDDEELQRLWQKALTTEPLDPEWLFVEEGQLTTTAVAAYPSVERSTEVTPLDSLVFMLSELRDVKRSMNRIAAILASPA